MNTLPCARVDRSASPQPRSSRLRAASILGAIATAILGVTASPATAAVVYAVSASSGEMIRFDTSNPAATRTTVLAGGSLVNPTAMAVGPDGNLYLGESGDGSTFAPRITRFEVDTLTISTVYAFSAFEVFPGSLAFKGSNLLIGRSPTFSNTGAIVQLTNATGGTPAVSDYTTGGSLASSPGLAVASDGRLFVSDQTYNFGTSIASGPVKQFDAAGNYVGEVIADGASGLAGPAGLAIDGSSLFTASLMSGTVLKTDLDTGTTTLFASTGAAFEASVLALLADGSLLVGSGSGSGLIYHFDANGTLMSTFASGLGQIGGIVVMPTPVAVPGGGGLLAAVLLGVRRRRR